MKYFWIILVCLLAACSTPETDSADTEKVEAKPEAAQSTVSDPVMPVMVGGDQSLEAQAYKRVLIKGGQATADEVTACEAEGGKVRPAGDLGADHCIQELADAGKTCANSAECIGECYLPPGVGLPAGADASGVCSPTDEAFGCHARVENGKATAVLCVD